MHKPIKDTFWTRVSHLVRGVLFYNTIYWKRASDEVRPPRLSARERKALMPVRNFDIIKPREKPRAKLSAEEEAEAAGVSAGAEPGAPAALSLPEASAPAAPSVEKVPMELVKKRHYSYHRKTHRRQKTRINPANPYSAPKPEDGGLIKKLFGKKD